jgi:hypothetical protein
MIRLLFILFSVCSVFSQPVLANDPPILNWDIMEEMNVKTGDMPDSLSILNGQLIEIAGFIVPLEMDEYIDQVAEFMLVPDPLACIHVPPPPPNQLIYVTMEKAIPLDMDYRGVAITGKLRIVKSADGTFGYEMKGLSAKEADVEYDDPLLEYIDTSY